MCTWTLTLTLHRFGGVYLDTDSLVLRPLPDLESYTGVEWAPLDRLAVGVMAFPPGHPVLEQVGQDGGWWWRREGVTRDSELEDSVGCAASRGGVCGAPGAVWRYNLILPFLSPMGLKKDL